MSVRFRARKQCAQALEVQRDSIRTSGFTLIELLVVIAIISVLASLLLPALGRAKSRASGIQCLGQMRQIGVATVFYVDDNQGYLPRSSHSAMANGQLPWGYALAPYLTSRSVTQQDPLWTNLLGTLYHCPKDTRPKNEWSYGKNVYPELSADETGGSTWAKLALIPRQTATILFAEKKGGSMADHIMAQCWYDGGQPDVDRSRHDQRSNYTYCDGHAAKGRFEDTFNPARDIDNWNPATAR